MSLVNKIDVNNDTFNLMGRKLDMKHKPIIHLADPVEYHEGVNKHFLTLQMAEVNQLIQELVERIVVLEQKTQGVSNTVSTLTANPQ
jgi:hypothetical protein